MAYACSAWSSVVGRGKRLRGRRTRKERHHTPTPKTRVGADWLAHRLQVCLVHLYPIETSPRRLAGRLVAQAGVDAALAAFDYVLLEAYNLHIYSSNSRNKARRREFTTSTKCGLDCGVQPLHTLHTQWLLVYIQIPPREG